MATIFVQQPDQIGKYTGVEKATYSQSDGTTTLSYPDESTTINGKLFGAEPTSEESELEVFVKPSHPGPVRSFEQTTYLMQMPYVILVHDEAARPTTTKYRIDGYILRVQPAT